MFVVVVCGGPHDGERLGRDGWPTYGTEPAYGFDDYADAQEFIIRSDGAINRGDYGNGATLGIDEIDGDVQERY